MSRRHEIVIGRTRMVLSGRNMVPLEKLNPNSKPVSKPKEIVPRSHEGGNIDKQTEQITIDVEKPISKSTVKKIDLDKEKKRACDILSSACLVPHKPKKRSEVKKDIMDMIDG